MLKLANKIEEKCNPFLEEGPELLAIDTNDCYPLVSETVYQIRKMGRDQYIDFKTNVLEKKRNPFINQ